jgi:two-component system sensor histidine kinase TrcS
MTTPRPKSFAIRWWRPHSLRRQLVLSVSAVVTVVLVVVGVISVLSLRTYVTAMNDAEISESLNAFTHAYTKYRKNKPPLGQEHAPVLEEALFGFTEQTPDNVIAVLHDGAVVASAVFYEDEPRPAPDDVVTAIEAQSWSGNPPHTLRLDGLGSYRMDSRDVNGDRLVVGVSLELGNRTITSRIITATLLLMAALVVTAGLTATVVGYALRPLRHVAATAAAVARMPLVDDDHITARVGQEDVDPDNEVGTVAYTLNLLLDNVDSALTYRTEADRRMRQFLTDASHELRTPLAAIQGYAQLTRQDSAQLPETSEYALARIESEAQRMALLVDELLLLSRLSEGHDLHIEDIDLSELVVDAVNDAAATAPTHRWVKDLPEAPVWIRGDRARLHQLATNLLKNAWVHTPQGVTVTTRITPHAVNADPSYAELTVTDNGPDVDPSLLPHLFDRFVRADQSRSNELSSTGLGLAIVDSIVKAHRGTVTAESSGGRTVFRVRLPVTAPPGRRHAPASGPEQT